MKISVLFVLLLWDGSSRSPLLQKIGGILGVQTQEVLDKDSYDGSGQYPDLNRDKEGFFIDQEESGEQTTYTIGGSGDGEHGSHVIPEENTFTFPPPPPGMAGVTGCENHEFSCSDGSCIPFKSRCDDRIDCPDESDETSCNKVSDSIPTKDIVLKGDKGEKGSMGLKGEPLRGPPGPPGPPGLPGSVYFGGEGAGAVTFTGEEGSGDDEQFIQVTPKAKPDLIGPRGPPGVCSCNLAEMFKNFDSPELKTVLEGVIGIDRSKSTGFPGLPGDLSICDSIKENGEAGSTGIKCLQGMKGEPGIDGQPGLPGPAGPPGPPGTLSSSTLEGLNLIDEKLLKTGMPGQKGETGIDGAPGPIGDRGMPGAKGDTGQKGEKGERGDRGEQGITGMKGDQGSKGTDGMPGVPGENGEIGVKGQKGETGSAGPPGPPGNAISNLNSASGKIDSDGKVIVGAKGDKGEKGDVGSIGVPGPPGLTGLPGPIGESGERGIPGSLGLQGPPGPKGEPGPPGTSTAGSSLKGEKGDRGLRGKRGKPGLPGPPGKPGPVGEIGLPGFPGRSGVGSAGTKGQKGEPGIIKTTLGETVLIKGEKGEPGTPVIINTSEDGVKFVPVPGPPGPPGAPGLSGPQGSPGVSVIGQKGEPGPPGSILGQPKLIGGLSHGRTEESVQGNAEYFGFTTESPPGPAGPPGPPGPSEPTKIVPGAVTFQTQEDMLKMTLVSPVGTLAYIIGEEALLVRVNKGWQYISLGSVVLLATDPPSTTTTEITATPFEASNLVNNQLMPDKDGPVLRMAALNEPYSGDIKGQRGADYACYRQARRAGLRGTFRAFLSSRVQNLDSIVKFSDQELPVVNIKGDVLFNSWKDIFSGNDAFFSQQPRIYSFSGKNILTDLSWPQKFLWHGSYKSGERAMDLYCDAWDSESTDRFGLASPLLRGRLLEQEKFSCNNRFAVLCIEATSQPIRRRRRKRKRRDVGV